MNELKLAPASEANAAAAHAADPRARQRRQQRRATLVQWLRKTHGWFGLWGATLGMLFGTSGIWLNHRAVLQLPPVAQQRSNTQLALPDPAPADAQALAVWLQTALQLDAPATSVRVEPAKPVAWAERGEKGGERGGERRAKNAEGGDAAAKTGEPKPAESKPTDPKPADTSSADAKPADAKPHAVKLMQPERWAINFGGPHSTIQVEAWAGNRSVSVRRVDNGLIGTLMNLHKGVGMPVAWILLVDTLAGSLILLSLSGLALWMLTHRRRVVGLAIFGSALALTAGLAISQL